MKDLWRDLASKASVSSSAKKSLVIGEYHHIVVLTWGEASAVAELARERVEQLELEDTRREDYGVINDPWLSRTGLTVARVEEAVAHAAVRVREWAAEYDDWCRAQQWADNLDDEMASLRVEVGE